ncbi:MAG: cadherin repeat domain-containing protein [Nitrospirae bacterium]|nr:cadherin repeat domain-containing protein [Nitrospirota bacterium]
MKRKLLIVLTVILSLTIFAEYNWAATLLPWVRFSGSYNTTAGIGTGSLTLNASVSEMDYQNGNVWKANVSGIETIYGAKIVLSGAVRTGNYSFNGDPSNPDDVTLSIVSSDGYVYFTSTLADSVFTQQGLYFVWLNQWLNTNDLATLNLHNVVLRPNGDDGAHPSRYISELAAYLGSTNVSGMKMQLYVPPSGNFTTNSSGPITFGLIDGLQSLNTPPAANAGPDVTISTNQVAATAINGTVTDADAAYTLTCRWTEIDESGNVLSVLQDWTPVGIDSLCSLNLSALSLGLGTHILNLDANDGEVTSSDNMTLIINNTAPHANAGNDIIITSEEVAATTIQGAATDFDGNTLLQCRWIEGTAVLQDWTLAGINGECPLSLGALSLGLGVHTLTLEATDSQATSSDDMILTINNTPPIANAGENITVTSDQIAVTAIQGTATDFDGDAITCRWTETDGAGNVLTVLQDWTPAGLNGECSLSLSTFSFGLGAHTLSFEANDGLATSSNIMILTINNSLPHAAPGGAGVYVINTPVILPGDASDFDGDMLYYEWAEGTNVLCSGSIQSVAGGTAVLLPDCVVSNLSLGMHTISLKISDGFNQQDIKYITVQIIDNIAPTIKPVANKYILWPPNHIMVNIAIAANATDNSGCPVTLNTTVTSNEPQYGLGSGDTGPDWTEPVIDQTTGIIYLQLRAERSGRGKGRVYTITITATDCSGNTSTAKVKVRVPHDQDNDDRKREDRDERDRDDRHDRKDCKDDRDD